MLTTVNIHEAKTHLSRLLAEVAAGAEVIIAKNGTPMAKLVSVTHRQPRVPGRFQGQISDGDEILQPLSPDEIKLWSEGTPEDPLRL